MEFKDIDDNYKISEYGNIINKNTNTEVNYKYINGYLAKVLKNLPSSLIYRNVYHYFCGELINGLTIDHIDRNKENNHYSNLRQVSNNVNQLNKEARVISFIYHIDKESSLYSDFLKISIVREKIKDITLNITKYLTKYPILIEDTKTNKVYIFKNRNLFYSKYSYLNIEQTCATSRAISKDRMYKHYKIKLILSLHYSLSYDEVLEFDSINQFNDYLERE